MMIVIKEIISIHDKINKPICTAPLDSQSAKVLGGIIAEIY
jgi:hypothetical protein